MIVFERKVQYHETDKMGIMHHANYIKWMEEARVYYLEQVGMPFTEFEKYGIVSPVVAVNIRYKSPSTFGDTLRVETKITRYNGIKLEVSYLIKNSNGTTVAEGTTLHCFMKDGKIAVLEREIPDFDEKFKQCIEA